MREWYLSCPKRKRVADSRGQAAVREPTGQSLLRGMLRHVQLLVHMRSFLLPDPLLKAQGGRIQQRCIGDDRSCSRAGGGQR